MALSPLSTHVGDYFDNDYFAVSPFSIGPSRSRVYFRLRPMTREPHATPTYERSDGPPSAVRVAVPPWRRGARSRPELRRWRLERAIATGSGVLTLGVSESPWGPFAPLVDVALVAIRTVDPPDLRFDPFRSGRGIIPRGFVHGLRRGVYAASQRARATTAVPTERELSSRAT